MKPVPGMLLALATASVLVVGGACGNPFGSTESHGSKFTPTIDNLALSRSSVFAGANFTISFDYADPQGDIDTLNLTFVGVDNPGFIQDIRIWPHRSDTTCADCHTPVPTLAPPKAGKMSITYAFDRAQNNPSGVYSVRISLTDEKNHQSETLQEEITLL